MQPLPEPWLATPSQHTPLPHAYLGEAAITGFTGPHSAPPLPPRPDTHFLSQSPLSLSPPPFFSLPLSLLPSLHLSGSGSLSSFLHLFLHLQPLTPSPYLQPYQTGVRADFSLPYKTLGPDRAPGLGPRAESHPPSSGWFCSLLHHSSFHIPKPSPQSPALDPGSGQRGWLMLPTHIHTPHLQGPVDLQGLFWEPPPGICKGAGAGLSFHGTHPPPLRGWASGAEEGWVLLSLRGR